MEDLSKEAKGIKSGKVGDGLEEWAKHGHRATKGRFCTPMHS